MQTRPVAIDSDRNAILALIATVEAADERPPLSEHKYVAVAEAEPNRATGIVGEVDGEIVAYASLVPATRAGEWGMELAIHPSHRTEASSRSLVGHGVSHLLDRGADRVRLWLYGPGTVTSEMVEGELGFRPERRLLFMRRPLPIDRAPDFPPSMRASGFRPGVDEDAWLAVNNAAFASHPENGGWTRSDLDERLRRPWFDAHGFRLLWEGDVLAGFCWTKIHPNGEGEIYVIAVAPSHQGQGLGRRVLLEGMRHLGEVGAPAVFLYSEASNQGAVALYEHLGFEVERVHRSFLRELDGRSAEAASAP